MLTLTHARLRAAQGDAAAARRILRAILARDPGDEPARRLLEELDGRSDDARIPETAEQMPEPVPAAAVELADRFRRELRRDRAGVDSERRIDRLRSWLERIERG